VAPTDIDRRVFEKLLPADHSLRRLKAAIDCEPLRALVADCYGEGLGAPAEDPVRMLKLSRLQFPYDRSDSQVLRQAQGTGALRFCLDFSLESPLPVPSLRSQLRPRRGVERFQRVFTESLRQGRARGLVKERLRLKAATPLIAHSASPSTLRRVAQTREQRLTAAEGGAATAGAAQRAQVEAVRAATEAWQAEQRLRARGAPRRALVAWGDHGQQRRREAAARHQPLVTDAPETACSAALEVAHPVLNDREPEATDKLLSLADPDARTGKHGDS
jgi:hypothetical protein